jgi:hypothetical protein
MARSFMASNRWLFVGVTAMFLIGIAAGLFGRANLQPFVEGWIMPIVAMSIMFLGLSLLFQVATSSPTSEAQRLARVRASALACAQIMFGVAMLFPDGAIKITLISVAALVTLAAFLKFPKRLFA